jgi:hypothetical protein
MTKPTEAPPGQTNVLVERLFGPQFVNLTGDWLASIPEVDARLRAQPSARVADLACGTAWSSIAIARAYPGVREDSAGTGTAIRPGTVHAYAAEAGSGGGEVLPIEHDFWRFYRLTP